MRRPFRLATVALLFSGRALADPPVLTVHCDTPSHAISPRLYGVFFEEINHAGDGGLLAELVRNGSFEEPPVNGLVHGWTLKTPASAGNIAIDAEEPAHAGAPHYLAVSIDGGATIENEGYWGIRLGKGKSYHVRVDARIRNAVEGTFSVTLAGKDGKTLARRDLGMLETGWNSFEADLKSKDDDSDARLDLTFSGKGTLHLDFVSLCPLDTWKGRPHGFRKDLGELFAGLSPAFVRFPGGCYVEGGDFLKDAFRWETTLGDVAQRPGHSNATWNYWSSDGLGFHEYLQTCEDLGAEALYVANCGLSHKEITAMDQLQPWIDECLNAIEYANGGVDTQWGALRAKHGHPDAFHLKYIEIGNENGLWTGFGGTRDVYLERYRRFYDAIKAKYPDVTTIADTRVDAPMEMVDDHYYNSPAWFWSNVGLYDHADRKGPKIYVGEYAVTQGCGTGNLAAALAEAAFMTGLERNSDVVTMASYAPMFVRAEDRKWNPDMMVFDGQSSYGTPSYHVQALFAKNRPDTLLPTDVPRIEMASIAKGGIGLGTWGTQAEFDDVVVEANGSVVYRSDFAKNTDGWKPHGGNWAVVNGKLEQTSSGDDIYTLLDLPALRDATDYTLSLKARKTAGREGFLVLFRAKDADDWCWWNIGGWGNGRHAIEKMTAGMKSPVGRGVQGGVEIDRWYDVRIELSGRKIRCFLDGKLVEEAEDRPLATFTAVAGRVDATGAVILKAVNGDDLPVRVQIDLAGLGDVATTAASTVLTAKSLLDENTFDAPSKIAPVSGALEGVRSSFEHEFPARSLTILRFERR